jgi:hypothetical protein
MPVTLRLRLLRRLGPCDPDAFSADVRLRGRERQYSLTWMILYGMMSSKGIPYLKVW